PITLYASILFLFQSRPPPPTSTPSPYTTLFRSPSFPDACTLVERALAGSARQRLIDDLMRSHPFARALARLREHVRANAFDPFEIGRAHVWTPVTWPSRMPSSA